MSKLPPQRVAPAQKQAVDAPRQSVFLVKPEDLVLIGLDTTDGPEHCLYDETVKDDPDEDLAESLGEFGQRQTLVVRKNGSKVEVVSGRTRTKAARLWNDAHPNDPIALACTICRGKSDVELMEAMIVENEHRKDKPPMVKAAQAARLQARGRSYEQVAKVFRVSLQTVHIWLGNDGVGSAGLVDAAPEIKAAATAGALSVRDVQAVQDLSHSDQAAALEIAKETGERLSTVATNLGGARAPSHRRRGNSTEPSTRPNLAEIRAAIEDKDGVIPWDRISPRDALKWSIGDLASLVANDA